MPGGECISGWWLNPAQGEGGSGEHRIRTFQNKANEHHQRDYCAKDVQGYFYRETCLPDGHPTHALCNPSKGRDCYAKHVSGEKPQHGCRIQIAKNAERALPQLAEPRRRWRPRRRPSYLAGCGRLRMEAAAAAIASAAAMGVV